MLHLALVPSANGLVFLVELVAIITLAYIWSVRGMPSWRGIVAFLLLGIGTLGLYDGLSLAAREESRLRHGRVMPGVVVEKYRPDGRGRTIATSRRQRFYAGRSGFLIAGKLAHWIAYGTPAVRMVDYRYPCAAGRQGTCSGRDYVSTDLWSRLSVGDPVNVRQGKGESVTARLDENPQLVLAAASIGVSAMFLTAAGLVSGRLRLRPRRRKYLRAEAVVTDVRPVAYGDEKRWKVHFAYFDDHGVAQESVDEVNQPTWKPGDACLAVYRPEVPDLATLQPLSQA